MREVKRVTFYDSAYHVLAIRAKGLYLTTDTAYVKRAKAKGMWRSCQNGKAQCRKAVF